MRRSPGPGGLSSLAVLVGWIGVFFAFRGHWLGVALPLVTTALAWLAGAVRRLTGARVPAVDEQPVREVAA